VSSKTPGECTRRGRRHGGKGPAAAADPRAVAAGALGARCGRRRRRRRC